MSLTPKTIGQLNPIDQVTATTLFLAEKNGTTVHVPYSEIAVSNYTSILYADLHYAHTYGNLIPGMFYLITDYETCYDRPNYNTYGDAETFNCYVASEVVEPLLVLATSATTLAAEAYSLTYPNDKIKYDITFIATEVSGNPAKGRITERIDEKNNRADYDFRNVTFFRYEGYFCETLEDGTINVDGSSVTGINTYFTNTFSVGDILGVYNNNAPFASFYFYEITNIIDDNNMTISGVNTFYQESAVYSRGISFGNKSPFPSNVPSSTANVMTFYTFDDNSYNTYLGDNVNYDMFILSNNVFFSGTYRNNTFGGNCVGNTFDDDMDSNTIGSYFKFNIMTNDFDRNTIGNYMERNMIDCDMESNRIGNYFQNNMIGDDDGNDFDFNLVGDYFENNFITMSNGDFNGNTIGRGFYGNIIDDSFYDNTIVGDFNHNTITNSFSNNTIGDSFYTNRIESQFSENSIGSYFYQNHILGSFRYNSMLNNCTDNNINGNFWYNKIGAYFYGNTIQDGFGTDGSGRGNIIGNMFYNNNIGTGFLGNVIADSFNNNLIHNNFQANRVEVLDMSSNNFKDKVNSIATVSINIGESTYTNGVYNVYQTANYSGSEGNGAQFAITVAGGSITNIEVTNGGNLYDSNNIIGISMDQIPGSTQDLSLVVNTLTQMPLVYQPLNSTISKAFDTATGDAIVISTLYNTGVYISKDFKGPLVLGEGGNNGGGGNPGSGSWYFYTTEGALTVGPPTIDGQAIFTDNDSGAGTLSTFNPNKNTGIDYLNFCLKDSAGTDYTTQFTALQTNGGTISVTQNGNTATYTLMPNMAYVNAGPGFVSINTAAATQTVTAASPFVYSDPISISFS